MNRKKNKKKYNAELKRSDVRYLTSNRINLDDWNDSHILVWILDTKKNDVVLRRFLVSYWLWRHRSCRIPIHYYGDINVTEEEEIRKAMKFWVSLFKERNLL